MNKLKEKFSNKKVKIFISCLIVFAIAIAIPYIVSYFSDSDSLVNIFTIGGNNVKLVEEFNPPEKLEQGTSFQKDVKVRNTGPNECYVRIKAVFTTSDVGQYCEVDWNTTDWVYDSDDGYWYYKQPIGIWEETTSLFTTVKLADDIPLSAIKDFDMIIYGESYQSKGFNTYEEAWADYEKNKDDELSPAVNILGLTATTEGAPAYANSVNHVVTVSASDAGSDVKSVTINGVNATELGDSLWTATISLSADEVEKITVIAIDNVGNSTTQEGYVRVDIEKPVLEVTEFAEEHSAENPLVADAASYTISGTVADMISGVKNISVNGLEATINADGTWTHTITLNPNETTEINVIATDKVGNSTTRTGYVRHSVAINYTVANNLTNVTTDNESESIEEGTKYEAIITIPDGYILDLDSLVITMGAVDITDVAYNEGVITIESVSDNVVITATAYRVYTVTNSLQYVISNNEATTIKENEVYAATIVPDEGYSLTDFNVVVTMGGEDITSTAYSNGVIAIDAVTGDIVITVTQISST